ncbi:uncharacterized protein LOC136033020 isoform X2 [Artemia franciscana]
MYLKTGVVLKEYTSINSTSSIQENTKVYPLAHTRQPIFAPKMARSSKSPYPAIEVDLKTLKNANIRVLDNLLDIYGFNITYEIVPASTAGSKSPWRIRGDAPGECASPASCSYNGHCYASSDFKNYSCSCFPNYWGSNCQKGYQCNSKDDNASVEERNPCQNGGSCSYVIGSSKNICSCKPGFSGSFCERKIGDTKVLKGSSGIVCSVGINKMTAINLEQVIIELNDTIETSSATMFTLGFSQARDKLVIFHLLFNNTIGENGQSRRKGDSSTKGALSTLKTRLNILSSVTVSKNEALKDKSDRLRKRAVSTVDSNPSWFDENQCGMFRSSYSQNGQRLHQHFQNILKPGSDNSSRLTLINSAKIALDEISQKIDKNTNSIYNGNFSCIFEQPIETSIRIAELKEVTLKDSTCKFELSVLEKPVKEGDNFELTCRAPYSPNRRFVWTKYDGKSIFPNNSIRRMSIRENEVQIDGCFSSSFEVKKASRYDSGVYVCHIEDCLMPKGQEFKKWVSVGVEVQPRVILSPLSASVTKGANLTISCFFEDNHFDYSNYTPHFSWKINRHPLNQTDGIFYEELFPSGSLLLLSNIEHSATYTCEVNNTVGVGSADVAVSIFLGLSCPQETFHGVKWNQTAAGSKDLQRCPWKYFGVASRLCEKISYTYDNGSIEIDSKWGNPNFSGCIHFNLSSDLKLFTQHAIGYGRFDPNTILTKMVNILGLASNRHGVTDLQSGGGEMTLMAMAAIQEYCWRMEKQLYNPHSNKFLELIAIVISKPTNIINPKAFYLLVRLLEDQVSLQGALLNASSSNRFTRGDFKVYMEKMSSTKKIYLLEGTDDPCPKEQNASVLVRPVINATIAYPDLDLQRFKHNGTFRSRGKSLRVNPASFLNTTIQRNDYPFIPPTSHWSFLFSSLPFSPPKQLTSLQSSTSSQQSDSFLIIIRLSVSVSGRTLRDSSFGCGKLIGTEGEEIIWDMEMCRDPDVQGRIAKCRCDAHGTYMLFQYTTSHLIDPILNTEHLLILLAGIVISIMFISLTVIFLILTLVRLPSTLLTLKAQFCLSVVSTFICSNISYKSMDKQIYLYPVSDSLVSFFSSLSSATQLSIAMMLFMEIVENAGKDSSCAVTRLKSHAIVLSGSWGASIVAICIYISVWLASSTAPFWSAWSPLFAVSCLTAILWITAGSGILAYLYCTIKSIQLQSDKMLDIKRESRSVFTLFTANIIFMACRLLWLGITNTFICFLFATSCFFMGMAIFVMYLIFDPSFQNYFRKSFKTISNINKEETVPETGNMVSPELEMPSVNRESKRRGCPRPQPATLSLLVRAGLGPDVQAAFQSSSGSDAEIPKRSNHRVLERQISSSTTYPSAKTETSMLSRMENMDSGETMFGVYDPEEAPRAPHNTPSFPQEQAKSLWILDWQKAAKLWHPINAFRARSLTASSDHQSFEPDPCSPQSSTDLRFPSTHRQRNESSSSGISCHKQSFSSGSNRGGVGLAPSRRPVFIKWRDPELGDSATFNNTSSESSSGERIVKPYPGKCYLRCSPNRAPPQRRRVVKNRVEAIDCGVQTSKELIKPFLSDETDVIVEATVEKLPDEYMPMDPAGSLAVTLPLNHVIFTKTESLDNLDTSQSGIQISAIQ